MAIQGRFKKKLKLKLAQGAIKLSIFALRCAYWERIKSSTPWQLQHESTATTIMSTTAARLIKYIKYIRNSNSFFYAPQFIRFRCKSFLCHDIKLKSFLRQQLLCNIFFFQNERRFSPRSVLLFIFIIPVSFKFHSQITNRLIWKDYFNKQTKWRISFQTTYCSLFELEIRDKLTTLN